MREETCTRRLRIRPRYCRLYTVPGVELAEVNYHCGELDWEIPLNQAALFLLDVWNWPIRRDSPNVAVCENGTTIGAFEAARSPKTRRGQSVEQTMEQ